MSRKDAKPTIVITGASGLIGTALVEHFAGLGWQVRALVRQPEAQPVRQHVSYHPYSLESDPSANAFKHADYLIHAAYGKTIAADTTIEAARRLVALSRRHKLRRNIFLSSMSAHAEALSGYGKQKLAVEKLFDGPRDTVIRLGLVLGDGGLAKQLVGFMRSRHIAPLIDGGNQPIQFLAIYDLVRIVEKILERGTDGTLMLGTPQVYTYREFYLELRNRLGLKVWFVSMPSGLLLRVIRTIRALQLPLAVSEDNLLGLKQLRAFDTSPDLIRLDESVDDLGTALSALRQDLLR